MGRFVVGVGVEEEVGGEEVVWVGLVMGVDFDVDEIDVTEVDVMGVDVIEVDVMEAGVKKMVVAMNPLLVARPADVLLQHWQPQSHPQRLVLYEQYQPQHRRLELSSAASAS